MSKVLIIVIAFCLFGLYWATVVNIATKQMNKGTMYTWQEIEYYSDKQKRDSFEVLRQRYYAKSDNTMKWIPKFVRP